VKARLKEPGRAGITMDRFANRLSDYYLERILGFAYNKTGDRSKAEDLAQDIIVEILTGLSRPSEIRDFDAWVWSIARYTYCHWLEKQSGCNEVRLIGVETSADEVDSRVLSEEELNLLRREIGFLSNSQRQTIIMHYYEGRSCDEIARILGIPVGTVKWRLFDARRDLKKGMARMRGYGQRSFNPSRLNLAISGNNASDGSPFSLVKRAIPQNILLATYDEPRTVEGIARELGIPVPYIEDEVQHLLDGELLRRMDGSKVQTNFIIVKAGTLVAFYGEVLEVAPTYSETILGFLETRKLDILNVGFYGSNLPWRRLLWILIPLCGWELQRRFFEESGKELSFKEYPIRPHGGKWIGIGTEGLDGKTDVIEAAGKDKIEMMSILDYNGTMRSDGKWWLGTHWSGRDSRIFDEIRPQDVELCRLVARNRLQTGSLTDEQKERLALLVEKGLVVKSGDDLRLSFPVFSGDQLKALDDVFSELYPQVESMYAGLYWAFRSRLDGQVPEYLTGEIDVNLRAYVGSLIPATLAKGVEKGLLSIPEDLNKGYLSFYVRG